MGERSRSVRWNETTACREKRKYWGNRLSKAINARLDALIPNWREQPYIVVGGILDFLLELDNVQIRDMLIPLEVFQDSEQLDRKMMEALTHLEFATRITHISL